jgi:hypothetical protein
MDKMEMVMIDLQDMIEKRGKYDNESDGLRNKADRRGNHVNRSKRRVNNNFDDFVDDNVHMKDDEFDYVFAGHGDIFQLYRGRRDDGFRRHSQFNQKDRYRDDIDGYLGII